MHTYLGSWKVLGNGTAATGLVMSDDYQDSWPHVKVCRQSLGVEPMLADVAEQL